MPRPLPTPDLPKNGVLAVNLCGQPAVSVSESHIKNLHAYLVGIYDLPLACAARRRGRRHAHEYDSEKSVQCTACCLGFNLANSPPFQIRYVKRKMMVEATAD